MLNLDQVQLLIINLSHCLLREVGEEVEVKREQSGSHGVIHGCMVLQGMSSLSEFLRSSLAPALFGSLE